MPPPPGGRPPAPRPPVPYPVPVPVPPPYYGGYGGYYGPNSGVAAGVALGAMLTILPATAIAVSNASQGQVIYRDGTQCYVETYENGAKIYRSIACP